MNRKTFPASSASPVIAYQFQRGPRSQNRISTLLFRKCCPNPRFAGYFIGKFGMTVALPAGWPPGCELRNALIRRIRMKKCLVVSLLAFVAANASATTLFSDDFNYSNGSLANHSATATQTGQVDVASSQVNLTATEAEDVSATITGSPYAAGTLYYSLLVNFSILPAGTGGYFAHFGDTTTGFRARLFATTVGAAPGFYRLAINNGSTPISATFATDLSLGSSYQAVVRYDLTAVATTLWVNPFLESDPSVSASDVVTGISVSRMALRQSTATGNGMGTLTADNVRVATSFVEVVPEPSILALAGLGGLLLIQKFRRRN
jgi:hypothetical protein